MYDNLLLRLCEFAVATRTGCVKVNYAKKKTIQRKEDGLFLMHIN